MKKLIVLLLTLTMLFALTACGSESTFSTPLEEYFPDDWADRYILSEVEGVSIDVFCKSAYDNNTDNGWLFKLMLRDSFPDHLPTATELGTYEGKFVVATYATDVYEFDSDDIAADYSDMSADVEEILHQLLHALGGEHDHSHTHDEPVNTDNTVTETATGTYVTPETLGITDTYVGVFRLDVTLWSEESKNELLSENDQNGFISIAPDGTAYLRCGSDITEGTVRIYSDPDHVPVDQYLYELTFDGKTYYANMFQTVLTIDDMPEYSDPNGLKGTSWTFIHETDDWWTEETLSEAIG